jgi:hypothetical protein
LWGNGIFQISGSATVTYSCVQGGWAGQGNIDVDPMFASAWGGNLRLLPGSPCIDAGDNSALPPDTQDLDHDGDTTEPLPLDLDGNPRVVDGDGDVEPWTGVAETVDMGAYEYAGLPTPTGLTSFRQHGSAGELGIILPQDGRFVNSGECRRGGPTKLVFTFSEPVQAADGTPDASEVELSAGTVDTVAINGNTMTVTLHGVPDASYLRIRLVGLVDTDGNRLLGPEAYVRVLTGDVNGDGRISNADVTSIVGRLGQTVTGANFRYDVDCSGKILNADVTSTVGRLGQTIGNCP